MIFHVISFTDSAPSLGVNYFCRWLCLSVCPSVCLFVTNFKFFFLFLDGIEPFFGHQFSMTPSTKRCSSIFYLGRLMPKIYSPKFVKKSPITQLVWQIDRRCLHLTGFLGMADSMKPCKMLWPDTCCHGNEIWARCRVQSPTGLSTLYFNVHSGA